MSGRFKKLRPFADELMDDYLNHDLNISQIAEKYDVHYSNLRRFIKHELKERGLEDEYTTQYFNCADFPYLSPGDTFSFGEGLSIWRVIKATEKEGDEVWELVVSETKSPVRHFEVGVNTPEGFDD